MLIKTIRFAALFVLTHILVNKFSDFSLYQAHPDAGLNVQQLIEKYGYPFENHTVQTEDGYILELHRIPYGRNNNSRFEKQPSVLLVSGLLCDSAEWVSTGAERGLGFVLADQGYDVWLANLRGTRWSRKHTTLNPDTDSKEYWDFSFHQMGYYDLPAFIDYIISLTNQEKLFYIGHSLGTTCFFALSSTRPEYNKKVRLSISLAPIAYSHNIKISYIHWMAHYQDALEGFVDKYQLYELLPYKSYRGVLATIFCSDKSLFQDICANLFFSTGGYSDQFNKTVMPVIISNAPAGSSVRQMQHFVQMFISKKFHQYDYGEEANLVIYGQSSPPEYDLKKITAPLAFYYGSEDLYCLEEDINRTASEVSNLIVKQRIEGFSHMDVTWGNDVVKLLYNDIFKLMAEY